MHRVPSLHFSRLKPISAFGSIRNVLFFLIVFRSRCFGLGRDVAIPRNSESLIPPHLCWIPLFKCDGFGGNVAAGKKPLILSLLW